MHCEFLKLGIDVGQTSVAKYMARRRGPPSQGSKTFLRNHADGSVAMDLFVVPTISFRLLYGLLIIGHRRQTLWFGTTAHPTAEWIANQLTEARGWDQIPHYLIRDRDVAYGEMFIREMDRKAIGVHDRVNLAGQAASRATRSLVIVVRDTGSVLVHAHDGGIDHPHRRIMTGGQRFHDPVPDASPPPANEAIVTSGAGTIGLWQVAPWRT
jgi:hypothetical protein